MDSRFESRGLYWWIPKISLRSARIQMCFSKMLEPRPYLIQKIVLKHVFYFLKASGDLSQRLYRWLWGIFSLSRKDSGSDLNLWLYSDLRFESLKNESFASIVLCQLKSPSRVQGQEEWTEENSFLSNEISIMWLEGKIDIFSSYILEGRLKRLWVVQKTLRWIVLFLFDAEAVLFTVAILSSSF